MLVEPEDVEDASRVADLFDQVRLLASHQVKKLALFDVQSKKLAVATAVDEMRAVCGQVVD